MVKIRNIASWITLITYLSGVLTLALFHFHAPDSVNTHDAESTFQKHSSGQFSDFLHSTDDCTFCKTSSQQLFKKTTSSYIQQATDDIFAVTYKLVYKRLIVDSLLRRGPPITG